MIKFYISVDEYLMGRAKIEDLPNEYVLNLNTLIPKVNDLLEQYHTNTNVLIKHRVSSGYRTPSINANLPNAAKKSKHMICAAVDLFDPLDKLDEWCMKNPKVLKSLGLYMEHPSATPNWCHLQCIPPKSGNLVFYP